MSTPSIGARTELDWRSIEGCRAVRRIEGSEMTDGYDDAERTAQEERLQTVTNDAVAGETVLPGAGEGNDGPTGGSPREQEPEYAESDLAGEEIDLGEEPD